MTIWPHAMRRKTAAAYLDMSEAAFLREVNAGRLPCAIMLGGREHWRKDALDRAIEMLAGNDDVPDWRKDLERKLA